MRHWGVVTPRYIFALLWSRDDPVYMYMRHWGVVTPLYIYESLESRDYPVYLSPGRYTVGTGCDSSI